MAVEDADGTRLPCPKCPKRPQQPSSDSRTNIQGACCQLKGRRYRITHDSNNNSSARYLPPRSNHTLHRWGAMGSSSGSAASRQRCLSEAGQPTSVCPTPAQRDPNGARAAPLRSPIGDPISPTGRRDREPLRAGRWLDSFPTQTVCILSRKLSWRRGEGPEPCPRSDAMADRAKENRRRACGRDYGAHCSCNTVSALTIAWARRDHADVSPSSKMQSWDLCDLWCLFADRSRVGRDLVAESGDWSKHALFNGYTSIREISDLPAIAFTHGSPLRPGNTCDKSVSSADLVFGIELGVNAVVKKFCPWSLTEYTKPRGQNLRTRSRPL